MSISMFGPQVDLRKIFVILDDDYCFGMIDMYMFFASLRFLS